MRYYVHRDEPVQEIAACQATLDELTARAQPCLNGPVWHGEPADLSGIPLVADPRIIPGSIHLRPREEYPA